MYELLVIGAGPAGLAAAIYGARSGLTTAVVERGKAGGTLHEVPSIDNYPGFENATGQQLLERLVSHARRYSDIIEFEEVTGIAREGDLFRVKTAEREHLARAVILATGSSRKRLGVRGEAELQGRGVSYCPLCDGYMYRGRRVVVVGGGNTAAVDAVFLRELGCDVTLVHRRDRLRAEEALVRRLEGVKILLNSAVEEISGENRVEGVVVRSTVDGSTRFVEASAVFVSVGMVPNSQLALGVGASLDGEGNVVVDRFQRTTVGRFYAAGDVTGGVRQVVVACAEGAVASLSAFEDIRRPYWSRASP